MLKSGVITKASAIESFALYLVLLKLRMFMEKKFQINHT